MITWIGHGAQLEKIDDEVGGKFSSSITEFFLTAQNLKLFGQKLEHFSNNAFQSCYDPFQVN